MLWPFGAVGSRESAGPRVAAGKAEIRTLQEIEIRSDKDWVLSLTALASFMMALGALIITTAFTTIRADFGSAVVTLQWAINAFNMSFAVLLLTGAALDDRFGRRRMFAAGIALFVAASVACALSREAGWLIAARAGQRADLAGSAGLPHLTSLMGR